MKRILFIMIVFLSMAVPVNAMEFKAPEVPESGSGYLSEEPKTFSEGLALILKEVVPEIKPSFMEAGKVCLRILAVALLMALVKSLPGSTNEILRVLGSVSIALILLEPSNTMLQLAVETIRELSDYGKLLFPVLTAALAAQGGTTTSGAMYVATAALDALLSSLISYVLVPMVYIFLCLSVSSSAVGESILEKMKGFSKWIVTWSLKIILYFFTGYMSITGVISGSADAAAVKAAKITISGAVPVVGSIISDASETILVSADIMKNAVGVYGMLAMIAVWIGPFIRIGIQYLMLKATGAAAEMISTKSIGQVIQDFSTAAGLLLAMTGTVCLLLLISVICFMKGVQ